MKQRLLALDVMRGITIMGMIIVNSPGTWDCVFPPLQHSPWNGITPTDLVFPFFLYMMGISMCISLKKHDYQLSPTLLTRILRRTAVLFLIGTFIYATAGVLEERSFHALTHVRTLGVLQRLALCYGIGSIIVCTMRHRHLPWLIAALLVGYFAILALGNGFCYGTENILSRVDTRIIGISHMYNDHGIDPEGILSTIPAVAHALVGFCMGKICVTGGDIKDKLISLFRYGAVMLMVGYLLQDACPLNKKVWSSTFVLVTCGYATLLLAVLVYYIDASKKLKSTQVFTVFGVNPLFCYVLSELLAIFGDALPLGGTQSVHGCIYMCIASVMGHNATASFAYAAMRTALVWAVGAWLYKKKIYIKI